MEISRKEELLKTLGLTEKQARIFLKALSKHSISALEELESFDLNPAVIKLISKKVMLDPKIFIELATELPIPKTDLTRLIISLDS